MALELVRDDEGQKTAGPADTAYYDEVVRMLRLAAGTLPADDHLRRPTLLLAEAYGLRAVRVMR